MEDWIVLEVLMKYAAGEDGEKDIRRPTPHFSSKVLSSIFIVIIVIIIIIYQLFFECLLTTVATLTS